MADDPGCCCAGRSYSPSIAGVLLSRSRGRTLMSLQESVSSASCEVCLLFILETHRCRDFWDFWPFAWRWRSQWPRTRRSAQKAPNVDAASVKSATPAASEKNDRELKSPPGFNTMKRGNLVVYYCQNDARARSRFKTVKCYDEAGLRGYLLALDSARNDFLCSTPANRDVSPPDMASPL